MPAFFFPMTLLAPEMRTDVVGSDRFRLHKRRWQVSIFDLYSLAAERHKMHLPVELMHIFLQNVNLEIEVDAEDYKSAKDRLDILRALLCLKMVNPSVVPFATSASINTYAGINDRSAGLQSKMHEGLREGCTHADICVEAWPSELTFRCILDSNADKGHFLGEGPFLYSVDEFDRWCDIEAKHSVVRAARRALIKAPLMLDIQSSILHIWQGIESLFPNISAEITFRTSLMLAELQSDMHPRLVTYSKAKKSYADRSRIAHGSQKEAVIDQWVRAWDLLRDSLQAVLMRGSLPSEEQLTQELLRGGGEVDEESMAPD